MCLIQGDVESVRNTKILVAPLETKEDEKESYGQLTIYSNQVALGKNSGAMVLPFPKSPCKLVDLSDYDTLFAELELLWPRLLSLGKSKLAVEQVGSYKASIVTDIADFDQLSDIFVIDPQMKEFLIKQYPKDFSFVVCLLDQDKKYHPFAYLHGRSTPNLLFIPTMHYHQHSVGDPVHPDWDHKIYVVNAKMTDVPTAFLVLENDGSLIRYPDKLSIPAIKSITGYKISPHQHYRKNHDMFAFCN